MALKKYEVDAVVNTIMKIVNNHNNQINIDDETITKVGCNESATFKKLIAVEKKIDKLHKEQNNLTQELASEIGTDYYGRSKPHFKAKIKKELEEIAGQVQISKEDVSNAVILSSGNDLNDIVLSVLKDLGFDSKN